MSPGECFGIIIAPTPISSKKQQKKAGSATVYTQYIEQKLVTCTCTRHIFTRMNMYALSRVCKLLFNILQIWSLSIRVRDKNHIFTTSACKIYYCVQILSHELGKRSTVLGTIPETTKQEVQIKS